MDFKPKFRRKKGWRHQTTEAPFPVPIESITEKAACDSRWFYYRAELIDGSVLVQKEGDGHFLYKMGFFGKGILSRGKPEHAFFISSFQGHQRKSLPASERRFQQSRFQKVRQHRYERHLSWKKMRDKEDKQSSNVNQEKGDQTSCAESSLDDPASLSEHELCSETMDTDAVSLQEDGSFGVLHGKSDAIFGLKSDPVQEERDGRETLDIDKDHDSLGIGRDETSGVEVGASNDRKHSELEVTKQEEMMSCPVDVSNLIEKGEDETMAASLQSEVKRHPVCAISGASSNLWEVNMDDWAVSDQKGNTSGIDNAPASSNSGDVSKFSKTGEHKTMADSLRVDVKKHSVCAISGASSNSWEVNMDDWAVAKKDESDQQGNISHIDDADDTHASSARDLNMDDWTVSKTDVYDQKQSISGINDDWPHEKERTRDTRSEGQPLCNQKGSRETTWVTDINDWGLPQHCSPEEGDKMSSRNEDSGQKSSTLRDDHLPSDMSGREESNKVQLADRKDCSEVDQKTGANLDNWTKPSHNEKKVTDNAVDLKERENFDDHLSNTCGVSQQGNLEAGEDCAAESISKEEKTTQDGSAVCALDNNVSNPSSSLSDVKLEDRSTPPSITLKMPPGESVTKDCKKRKTDNGEVGSSKVESCTEEDLDFFSEVYSSLEEEQGGEHNIGRKDGEPVFGENGKTSKLDPVISRHSAVVRKPDPYPIQEFLQLGYEEAFFLSYGLGCLSLYKHSKGTEKAMDLSEMWREFRTLKPRFLATYAVYHYYRSKGWVPRCGMKYGCDFVIYKKGPTFYHSSFAVLAHLVSSDSGVTTALSSWASFTGFSRIVENSAKDVLICFVICPEDFSEDQLQSPACIPHLKVKEVCMKRWRPTRERERKDYPPLIS